MYLYLLHPHLPYTPLSLSPRLPQSLSDPLLPAHPELESGVPDLAGQLLEVVEEDLVEPGVAGGLLDAGGLAVVAQGDAAGRVQVTPDQTARLHHLHSNL